MLDDAADLFGVFGGNSTDFLFMHLTRWRHYIIRLGGLTMRMLEGSSA